MSVQNDSLLQDIDVDNQLSYTLLIVHKKINFYIMHKSKAPFLFCGRTYSFGLVKRQAFHQPPELLSGQRPDFGCIFRPLESAWTIDPFVEKAESIPIEI